MNNNTNIKIANKVSIVSVIANILLSILKLFAGILGKSSAMVSDAVHSASDVLSTFAVMIGVNIGNKQTDNDHQYGHEKIECIFALFVGMTLLITGLGIGADGIEKIIYGFKGEKLEIPTGFPLVAAVVSILIKEAMYWYTKKTAIKIKSGAMMADAWHHRSDALSSIGSMVGIIGARLGFPIMDPIASVIICTMIVAVSFEISKDSISKLTDKACPVEINKEMKNIISSVDGVKGIDKLNTRLFGSKFYVDVEISADGDLSLFESHQIAENVHRIIEKRFTDAKHCMVHVNPYIDNLHKNN